MFKEIIKYIMAYHYFFINFLTLSARLLGGQTPFSVIMAVIRFAGVTSNAGFQHPIPF